MKTEKSFSNTAAKHLCGLEKLKDLKPSFLDKDNILWKFVNGDWTGKSAECIEGRWQWNDK
jgi:hypothetical protein